MIAMVSIVKSRERWINSLTEKASFNSDVRGRWINSRIDNTSFNSDVRGKMDKQSY